MDNKTNILGEWIFNTTGLSSNGMLSWNADFTIIWMIVNGRGMLLCCHADNIDYCLVNNENGNNSVNYDVMILRLMVNINGNKMNKWLVF